MGDQLTMDYQPAIAKYKIEKDRSGYIIHDLNAIGVRSIIGVTYTFWGAKRKMKKHIKSKKEEPTKYYFTENGVLINEQT